MNEFTKDELDKLKLATMILYDKDGLLETKRLAYRPQSMIDNYCHHKCKEIRDANMIKARQKCGVQYK